MKRQWIIGLAVGGLAVAACRDSTGPDGNASSRDRQEILAAIDAAKYSEEVVSFDGYGADFLLAALAPAVFPASAAPDAEVVLPRMWGRRLGAPTSRNRTINVSGDTARVDVTATFDGRLLALIPRDNAEPDTLNRPFRHTVTQKALAVKRDSGGRRGWHLAQVSAQQWVMTEEARRTIRLTRVVISVNGQVKLDLSDPARLYDVNNQVPRLQPGDQITVRAEVTNTAGTGNTPPEFLFVHVLHADPAGLAWRRMRMERASDGSYLRTWVVRVAGRDRIVVDAMDSQTFARPAGEYRANVWGIPYRIEG